jgi:hypothetical protein
LYLEEVNYTSFDDVKGSSLRVRVPQGIVRVSKMNLPGKILLVDQVVLDRPELHLESRIEHPLPRPSLSHCGSPRLLNLTPLPGRWR